MNPRPELLRGGESGDERATASNGGEAQHIYKIYHEAGTEEHTCTLESRGSAYLQQVVIVQ